VHHILDSITDRLTHRSAGVFSRETVERCVNESYDLLAVNATVTTHLSALTERFAADRLRAAASTQGAAVGTAQPEVLFVCVQNAGRSQMAAALLNHHAQGRVTVRSAGSAPAADVDPAVVEVMREIGIDISQEFPKPLTNDVVQASDVVITMGCGDACPIFPGKRYLDWELEDPAGKTREQIRPIRDDIDGRIRNLLAELAVTA
jgi:protein-tyrosine-phosphatase